MVHYIQLGGQQRPVEFGFGALYRYEQRTGRNALQDFASMSGGGLPSVTVMVDLTLSGLLAGYAKTKLRWPEGTEPETVADWLSDDQEALNEVMKAFADSFPQDDGKAKANGAKKKPALTGKRP